MLRTLVAAALASWAIASPAAIAGEPGCDGPARIEPPAGAPAQRTRVSGYRPVFLACSNGAGAARLVIRRFSVDGAGLMLAVDPATLATSIEREACWSCADADEASQKETRYLRAVSAPSQHAVKSSAQDVVFNAGLSHGAGEGSFITADLCPSRAPLDRAFVERLKSLGPATPVALAASGLWLTRHWGDFAWLRAQERAGALNIVWVNHSYRHPFAPGRAPARTYLMTPGFDAQADLLDNERLLIANGATPSVFYRFPGLYADAALIEMVRRNHLVALGADGWLTFSPPLRPGAILLVHANGNEPAGLRLFSKLLDAGRLPRPFRPIGEAPSP